MPSEMPEEVLSELSAAIDDNASFRTDLLAIAVKHRLLKTIKHCVDQGQSLYMYFTREKTSIILLSGIKFSVLSQMQKCGDVDVLIYVCLCVCTLSTGCNFVGRK